MGYGFMIRHKLIRKMPCIYDILEPIHFSKIYALGLPQKEHISPRNINTFRYISHYNILY